MLFGISTGLFICAIILGGIGLRNDNSRYAGFAGIVCTILGWLVMAIDNGWI